MYFRQERGILELTVVSGAWTRLLFWEFHTPKNKLLEDESHEAVENVVVMANITKLTGNSRSETASTWLTPGNSVVTCPVPTQEMKTSEAKVFL